jgi:hypothetical protein
MKTVILSLLSVVSVFAETAVFKPSQDSDIYAFFDGPSFSIFDLNVGAGGSTMAHSHHALVKFNLASLAIPAAEMGSAKLRLFALQPDSANGGGLRGGNVAVHRQGANWAVAGLRWSHLQAQERVGQPVGGARYHRAGERLGGGDDGESWRCPEAGERDRGAVVERTVRVDGDHEFRAATGRHAAGGAARARDLDGGW